MELSRRVAARIAPLIGVSPADVHLGDCTSVSLFKTTVAAARLRPDRTVLVVEPSTFPTDGYITAGVADLIGPRAALVRPGRPAGRGRRRRGPALADPRGLPHRARCSTWPRSPPEAQARGALVQWDLCHSTGAVPVDLTGVGADLAVGCTYKYLNGGPGSPAFLWVAPQHQAAARQPITGWMGHATPFAMARDYAAAEGIRASPPAPRPVLALSALEAALEAFDGVSARRAAGPLARADRPVHRPRRRAPARASSRSSPRATTSGAAARSPCATPRRTAWSRR